MSLTCVYLCLIADGTALHGEKDEMPHAWLEWKDSEQVAFLGSSPADSDINGFIKFSCELKQPWLLTCGGVSMAVPLAPAGWCGK